MPRGVRVLAVGTAVALAVLVGLSALVGAGSTALAVGFASVVLAWGWVRLTDAPSPAWPRRSSAPAAVADRRGGRPDRGPTRTWCGCPSRSR